jgi:hypothetical protein
MTVLAWDGKVLASDSRSSSGGNINCEDMQKIYLLNDVYYPDDKLLVIAMSGLLSDFDRIMHYLHSADFPLSEIQHDIDGIIVGDKFVYRIEHNNGYLIRYPKKTKLGDGSGGHFAKSAMTLGLTAIQAVKHAIKLNAYCGGKVQVWDGKTHEV